MVSYKQDEILIIKKAVGLFEHGRNNEKQAQGLSGQNPEAEAYG